MSQSSSPAMTVDVNLGYAYITGTPSGQASQNFRAKMSAAYTAYAISANSSGSTKYDWIYLKLDAAKAANSSATADDVISLYTSRSSSNTADNGTPPTYGILLAVVTVSNGASSIVNANIVDKRYNCGIIPNTIVNWDGWSIPNETWTYSAWDNTTKTGTITVPSDGTTKYCVNDWIKISQSTGGVKYGKIKTVTATQITVNMLTYTLNNEAITNNFYSHSEQPVGAPNLKNIKFGVYPSASQTGLTSTSTTIVAFNTKQYDPNNNFNTSTYKYTCPVSGYYHFDTHIRCDGSLTGSSMTITGSNVIKFYQTITAAALTSSVSGDSYCNAGTDIYVSQYIVLSGGTGQITSDSCGLTGYLISAV